MLFAFFHIALHCRSLHVYHKPNTYLFNHKQSDLKVTIAMNFDYEYLNLILFNY